MIYPENFELKIGFDKIKSLVKDYCLSGLGEVEIEQMTFSSNKKLVKEQLREVTEFKIILQEHDGFPIDHFYNLKTALNKLKIPGLFLETSEIFNLRRALNTIKSIKRFFTEFEQELYQLNKLAKDVKIYPFVSERIDQIINKQGKIKDKASDSLFNIRKELNNKLNSVSKIAQSVLKKSISEGWVEKDTNISIRDGRAVIPVQASHKRRISGLIHDVSATGKTAFVEPAEIIEINNAIKELESAEKREIIKILVEFADSIRPYYEDLMYSFVFMAKIDFIRAKAKLSIDTRSLEPKFDEQGELFWEEAIHPLLARSLSKEGKKVVPLSIQLTNEKRLILISGPNAGGKSVCLQTVGLLQYMLQCGLHIPVKESSKACLFENIFIDIGDEQSIENDLSTYSSHLINMKHFIRNANEDTLILIDEFGSGTEPMLGGAIAESILNKLNNKKIKGVLTTHYTSLKHFASSVEGIENGAMLYDTNRLEPLFILEIGKPGSSFAFEIAHKIGLPTDVIDLAKEKIGVEHIHFDKHLKEIIRDKRYWENKRKKIRKDEKRLEETLQKYGDELKDAIEQRKNIVKEAKLEAEKLLQESNRKIEQTIRGIRENQAEKERTKKLRQNLNQFKEEAVKKNTIHDSSLLNKLKQVKNKEKQLFNKAESLAVKKSNVYTTENLSIGDYVKIIGQESIGEIIDKNSKNLIVAFGQMITSIDKSKVEAVNKKDIPKTKIPSSNSNLSSLNIHKKRMDFRTGIDVRGKRVDEALQLIIDYIDEAIMINASEVKILHGKGNGVLRQVIRDYLGTVASVRIYKDEHIDLGGAGITVVHF